MNMRQLPSEERPREKLLRAGKENLSTTEILAILLRSGTKDRSALELASDLITISPDGIGYLAECRPEELASIRGIGLTKACEILAAVELGKRIASRPSAKRIRISSAKDIAEIFMERMRYYKLRLFLSGPGIGNAVKGNDQHDQDGAVEGIFSALPFALKMFRAASRHFFASSSPWII